MQKMQKTGQTPCFFKNVETMGGIAFPEYMKKPNTMSPHALEGAMRGERPLPRGLPDLCRRVTAREIFPAEIKKLPEPTAAQSWCSDSSRLVEMFLPNPNLIPR